MNIKKAKGFSKSAGKHVEGTVYHCLKNGVNILTENGLVFVENGEYELLESEEEDEKV